MRVSLVAILCSALIGLGIASSPALAQQKTVKACQEEWRANKADNQAKGITEKAYVVQCRAGSAATPAATGRMAGVECRVSRRPVVAPAITTRPAATASAATGLRVGIVRS